MVMTYPQTIRESCSCGAKIDLIFTAYYPQGDGRVPGWVTEQVEAWRKLHRPHGAGASQR